MKNLLLQVVLDCTGDFILDKHPKRIKNIICQGALRKNFCHA